MDFLKDIWSYLKNRKKWFLAPVFFIILLLGLIITFAGNGAIAPFVYTLF